jgi:hypothetical protein
VYEIAQQRTALVIPVFEENACIQAFRTKHIQTPAATMPPHITICGPFIPLEQIDEKMRRLLASFFASQEGFCFRFEKVW